MSFTNYDNKNEKDVDPIRTFTAGRLPIKMRNIREETSTYMQTVCFNWFKPFCRVAVCTEDKSIV